MKKVVNNKTVNIRNMELFEKAFEAMALNKHTMSSIKDTFIKDEQIIGISNDCISKYNTIHKSLPFPLYAIEDDVKYAAIALYIKSEIDEVLELWVDNGLNIYIGDNKALKFLGNTWGVTYVKQVQEDNTDIEIYRDCCGYREYKWSITQLMRGEGLKDFYNKFMTEFVEACNNDLMIMKWELGRILEIGKTPEEIKIKNNTILNLDNQSEIFIDIFSTGKRKTGQSEYIVRIGGDFEGISRRSKSMPVFDFELYEKSLEQEEELRNASVGRLRKIKLPGVINLFEAIVGRGVTREGIENVRYKGIIADNKLIYQVDSSIRVCDVDKYDRGQDVANNVELSGYEEGFIYFVKETLCDSGAKKATTYAYSLSDSTIRISCISYFV